MFRSSVCVYDAVLLVELAERTVRLPSSVPLVVGRVRLGPTGALLLVSARLDAGIVRPCAETKGDAATWTSQPEHPTASTA